MTYGLRRDKISADKGSGDMMQWLAVFFVLTAVSAGAGVLSSLHLLSTIQRIADSQKEVQEQPVASAFSRKRPASQDLRRS